MVAAGSRLSLSRPANLLAILRIEAAAVDVPHQETPGLEQCLESHVLFCCNKHHTGSASRFTARWKGMPYHLHVNRILADGRAEHQHCRWFVHKHNALAWVEEGQRTSASKGEIDQGVGACQVFQGAKQLVVAIWLVQKIAPRHDIRLAVHLPQLVAPVMTHHLHHSKPTTFSMIQPHAVKN